MEAISATGQCSLVHWQLKTLRNENIIFTRPTLLISYFTGVINKHCQFDFVLQKSLTMEMLFNSGNAMGLWQCGTWIAFCWPQELQQTFLSMRSDWMVVARLDNRRRMAEAVRIVAAILDNITGWNVFSRPQC